MDTTSSSEQPGGTVPPGPRPTGTDSFFDSVRRLGIVRSDDRWVGGVAGGLGMRLGIDPLLARGLFVVAALVSGVGLVLYGVGWALLPEQRDGRIHAQEMVRGRFDVALVGAFVAIAAGLSSPRLWNPFFWWFGDWAGGWETFWWVVGLGLVAALVVTAARGSGTGTGPATSLPRTAPGAPGAPGAPVPPVPPAPPAPDAPAEPAGAAAPPVTPEGPRMSPDPSTSPAAAPSGPRTTLRPPVPPHGAPYPPYGQPPYGAGAVPPVPPVPPAGFGPAGRPGPTGPAGPAGPRTSLPRTRPGGPGAVTVGVVVGLTLLTLAGLMYTERVGDFSGPVLATAVAVGVVLCGLGIVVAGLRGRTSGGLSGLAILGIVLAGPVLALTGSSWTWNRTASAVGDVVETPRAIEVAEDGFSVGAGQARIDLTELPFDQADGPVEVPISVGAGDVVLLLPDDVDYRADLHVVAGEILVEAEGVRRNGVGRSTTLESPAVAQGADPDLYVEVTVGAGQIRVVED